jgi:hypothetical protein
MPQASWAENSRNALLYLEKTSGIPDPSIHPCVLCSIPSFRIPCRFRPRFHTSRPRFNFSV